ncbi:autotransporter domain-containing protein [Candidatus Tisiphia endosymbiont of Micropterix aruncella]|uniref:autotransporter outer membrane beta-barrel domain-containing protein n=1 Tax=Candidatus Tisiphia endosymbiont of Micropterix aruncella TaxID=3066271 RepID=UPI003AA80B88
MPVANVPQQVGLEGVGVGHNPAPLLFPDNVQQQGEDGDGVRRSPIHVYVPQDHQEQQDHLQIDIEEHVPPVGEDGAVGGVPPAGRVAAPPPAPLVEEAEEEHVPPAGRVAAPPPAPLVEEAEEEHVPPAGRVPAPPPAPLVEEAEEEHVPPAGRVPAPPPAPLVEETEEEHVPPAGRVPAPLPAPPVEEAEEEHVPPAERVPAPPPAPLVEEAEEEHVPPAEAIAPQEKVAQVARITAALAEELLQKQKETVRNIALALNEIIILSHEFANSSIDLRLSDLKHLNNLFPPAAGDEDNIVPKNMWVSGTIGITKYNGKCLLSSYTGRTSATTIGGDLELPNGSIMGGAYNYVLSHFKYKNHTDKVAAHTHVISIYGQTNLSEKLILQGFLSRAFANVSAKLPVQNQLAKAKFANSSYSSKIVVAYKSKVGKALIIPHIGLKYGGQDIAEYEASFEKQSLSIAATNSRRSSGLIGFEAIMPMKISDTTQVIPRLHMEVEKFLHNKQQKLHMQVMSGPSSKEEILLLEKPAKYNYKIGGTITIKRGSTEIMAVYNYLASNNKYSSHQGSLKLKLSF